MALVHFFQLHESEDPASRRPDDAQSRLGIGLVIFQLADLIVALPNGKLLVVFQLAFGNLLWLEHEGALRRPGSLPRQNL